MSAIAGVTLEPLRIIGDARGAVLHVLRCDSPSFRNFGEVYVSEISPGVFKGWKRHSRMTQHIAVPQGRVRFSLFDDRRGSPTFGVRAAYDIGRPDRYLLIVVPPLVWYGWEALGGSAALLVNCADLAYEPGESEQVSTPPGLPEAAPAAS
jgi:dTDP-4-dehydrorhamnose 3,5-epimerase